MAHTYLSAKRPLEQVGNLVADWIKGRALQHYPTEVRQGILLHRFIDSYTDRHPAVQSSKVAFRKHYGKYAGIVVDVVYDHFLAANWQRYSSISLGEYVRQLEGHLAANLHLLPESAQSYFTRFMRYRWLESYVTVEGIGRVLFAMGRFTSLPTESSAAIEIMKRRYDSLAEEFELLFSALSAEVEQRR